MHPSTRLIQSSNTPFSVSAALRRAAERFTRGRCSPLRVHIRGINDVVGEKGLMLHAGVAEESREGVLQLSEAIKNEPGSCVVSNTNTDWDFHMTLAIIHRFGDHGRPQQFDEAHFSSLADPRHEFGTETVDGRHSGEGDGCRQRDA